MLIVETIAKVRRAYFSDGKSIKAICRELRLSRKIVRKVIRSGETSFSYERAVQPRPKLGQWTTALDELLEAIVDSRNCWSFCARGGGSHAHKAGCFPARISFGR
jgi:hypothetical protein